MKLKIGNIELDERVVLAPMAGVTDITYRTICKEMGAGLVCTEMVSAKGLYYNDIKTNRLMKINENNRPVSLQIFGSDPDVMAYVVEKHINERKDIDIIDVNMGCPTPKIVKNGDGSALMKTPELAGSIINKIKKVSNKPVTAKIRAGWDSRSINAAEVAQNLEYNGVDLIAVHGRTREQFYTGKSSNNIIKEVKEKVNVPVIGNGDIFTPEDAVKMIKDTGCDGVMVGRGILGNPWLIKNIVKAFNNDYDFYVPTSTDKIQIVKRHAEMLIKELDEKIAILEMRKFAAWYMKGMKGSSEARNKINKISKADDLYYILDEYSKFIGS
ncbi:tRNA dihydrouridine synthase DusB [Sedimentibacter hydroxybenzoicus DSM 7310]|uniref:tRNA-dihydrouridine synthase n=1 Tax=Sedimentibacter hydroxybenzoicus DSM 7310 TaxID=1123245 RepID=A0A974GY94_SEDHY|nr:tRNA dihydrouridine synthase DusB [Sedimentibacter hydroxybenzoicus]NYB75985.1 tRNA dihydrouridine synthase DusB [Sedimentibacter hydroxybenzoicus DSM 7310]